MNHLSILVGAVLVCAPFSASLSIATAPPGSMVTGPGATTLVPLKPAPAVVVHPHHPMATKVAGAQGNVTFVWFTVPHNPDEVKANTKPDYTWSRGFSLNTEVPLKCGDVVVKAGRYRVSFKLDVQARNWSVVLSPAGQRGARGGGGGGRQDRGGRGKRDGGGRGGQGRAGQGGAAQAGARIEIPMKTFAGEHAEHMAVVCVNRGYKTVSRRDPTPAGGTAGEFRISFGDIHTSWGFEEVFEARPTDEPGEEKKK